MRCANCGEELRGGARFCPSCGTQAAPRRAGPSRVAIAAALVAAAAVTACGIAFMLPGLLHTGGLDLAEVEDEAFRSYLAEVADADGDGWLSAGETDAVTTLGGGEGSVKGPAGINITSMRGIEHFKNLRTLNCSGNEMEELDLSRNTKLERVICADNELRSLELPAGTALARVECSGNALGSLDISDCRGVEYLDCSDNGLSELALPAGDALVELTATGNALTSVDLSRCGGLERVSLDEGVEIWGGEPPGEDAQAKIEDMALTFAMACAASYDSEVSGELVATYGNGASVDAALIYQLVYTNMAHTSNLERDNPYDLEYSQDVGRYSVPLATGRQIVASYYGSCPDDLSYVEGDGLEWTGSGWELSAADGPFGRTIATEGWFAYGRLAAFDATVRYADGVDDVSGYSYRVVAVEDDSSIFGYHLVSMLLQDYELISTTEGYYAEQGRGSSASGSSSTSSEASADAARAEFQARLDALDAVDVNSETAAMSQREINSYSSERYGEYDALLNDVYSYLEDTLSPDDFATIQDEEIAWMAERDAAMDDAASFDAKGRGSGTSATRLDAATESTRGRIKELIALI